MIKVDVLASGSAGNCYRISDGTTSLLLECGIPLKEIRERLDFGLSRISGCLVTHEHMDHAKACEDLLKHTAMNIYASQGTINALNLDGHRVHKITSKKTSTIGTWRVLPFDTVHDAAEPLGFVLASGAGTVLFATDTAYVRYRVPSLTHVMIECNYCQSLLDANVQAGRLNPVVGHRIIRNHMSLARVKAFFRANDLSRLQRVWLLHLSAGNSDAERFKREIMAITGAPVVVA